MRLSAFIQFAFLASSTLWGSSAAQTAFDTDQLLVKTTSGMLVGRYNATGVRAFLGVRYAFPPTGVRRFAAPIPFDVDPSTMWDATSFGSACPGQYYPGTNIYTLLPFLPFSAQNEDCLTLNVWAPSKERIKAKGGKLPILVFIHGGSFTQGGSAIEATDATHLVQSHDIIVVTMNYRLSVFGFPNFGSARNAGMLDQRVGLEWARTTAAQFGGDPSRITLFGQSAGAISADVHMFAKWNSTPGKIKHDSAPIASGVGILSGGVFLDIFSTDKEQVHFGQLGAAVGCTDSSSKALITCMQNTPINTLMNEIVVNGTARGWNFAAVPDERLIFSNYTELMLNGNMSKVPTFISTLENEATGLIPFDPKGINETLANEILYGTFVCTTSKNANLRVKMNVPTYRARYSGNFTNISPYPFLGTYHGAELPMIFGGAVPTFGGRNATAEQIEIAQRLQSYIVAFASNPKTGLSKLGWPLYNPTNNSIVVISPSPSATGLTKILGSKPAMVADSSARYDATCNA